MKAVTFLKHGGLDELRFTEAATPRPAPGQVRVRVRACALNHLDIWVRQGLPGPKIPLPHISGSDIAGVVDLLGAGVRVPRPGTPVIISPGIGCGFCPSCRSGNDNLCPRYELMGYQRQGGYAEFAVAPAAKLIPIDNRLSLAEWASIPLVFVTAWHMLVARAKLKRGETVLVHSAGSGIGTAAIQIGRLLGARVIATAGTPSKQLKARRLGAHEIIPYRKTPFDRAVLKMTKGRGADVIFDHIGPETWPQNLACLGKAGRMVFCGSTSGPATSINLRYVFVRQLSLLGSYMGTFPELKKIVQLVRSRKLKPVLDSVYPLKEAANAQKKMLERRQFGKIVLEI